MPNLALSLELFLTVSVTVASRERNLFKLKLIKHYLRPIMGESRLSDLVILSIEREEADSTNFDVVINDFASAKSRSARF